MTSLEYIWAISQVNKNLDINYSTKFLSINDKIIHSIVYHQNVVWERYTTLGIHWEKDGFDLGGSIGYQNIILDKANIWLWSWFFFTIIQYLAYIRQ